MSENNNNNNTSDSLYSYSYVNEGNQERNPNYYERKEAESQSGTNRPGMNQSEMNQSHTGQSNMNQSHTGQPNMNQSDVNQSHTGQPNTNQYTYTGAAPQQEQTGKQKGRKRKIRKPHGFGATLGKTAAIALVFGLVSGTVFYGTGYVFDSVTGRTDKQEVQVGSGSNGENGLSATNVSNATTVNDVSDIVENVMPSIVSITNMGEQTVDFFGQKLTQETEGAGSGIIIGQTEDTIYIATNNHVIANAAQLIVSFIDDQGVPAEVKGIDASTDLAVIAVAVDDIPKETLSKIKVATLGNSDDIKVGAGVVAIGNALGYGQSVTTGVISALNREVTVQDESTGASVTNDLLQTSAAINPGNSGGALLNMKGEVIGINSVKYSDEQVEGMGFAIPISQAEPIIRNLINREAVDEKDTAYLGISGQDVNSQISEAYGMPEGVYVTLVKEDSAAAKAGIRKGDIITKFDGRNVNSMNGLKDNLQYYAAGTEVEIVVQKNVNGEWKEQTVSVKLGKKNN